MICVKAKIIENNLDFFRNEMGKSWKIFRTVICQKNKDQSKLNIKKPVIKNDIQLASKFKT